MIGEDRLNRLAGGREITDVLIISLLKLRRQIFLRLMMLRFNLSPSLLAGVCFGEMSAIEME
ncbi:hypothetical protein XF14_08725 [Burkholderia gladioli]|nr:hypothetical protein XF14_08725 [Burkholderia gladioli]